MLFINVTIFANISDVLRLKVSNGMTRHRFGDIFQHINVKCHVIRLIINSISQNVTFLSVAPLKGTVLRDLQSSFIVTLNIFSFIILRSNLERN
jgi:hypothetical protein